MRDDLTKNIVGILREAEADKRSSGTCATGTILLGRPFRSRSEFGALLKMTRGHLEGEHGAKEGERCETEGMSSRDGNMMRFRFNI